MSITMTVKVDGQPKDLANLSSLGTGKSRRIQMCVDFLTWIEFQDRAVIENGDQDPDWFKGIRASQLMRKWVSKAAIVDWEWARDRDGHFVRLQEREHAG